MAQVTSHNSLRNKKNMGAAHDSAIAMDEVIIRVRSGVTSIVDLSGQAPPTNLRLRLSEFWGF